MTDWIQFVRGTKFPPDAAQFHSVFDFATLSTNCCHSLENLRFCHFVICHFSVLCNPVDELFFTSRIAVRI